MARTYSYGELENLWIDAGGPRKVAPVMAAIALAESGGNPRQKHYNPPAGHSPATWDRGLWQINSSHGYSASSSFNPKANARQAVAVYRSQGLGAWTTYKTGAYKRHLQAGPMTSGGSGGFGILTAANQVGVDQGVDYRGAGPIPALDTIRITSVRKVSIIEGGSWPLVGFQYESGPYKGRYGYLMENFIPKVRVGQKLKRGQVIGIATGSYPYVEYGFAANASGTPLAPLGADPRAPTAAGQAMLAYIGQRAGDQVQGLPPGGASHGPTKAPASGQSPAAAGGGQGSGGVTGAVTGLGSSIAAAGSEIASPFVSIAHTGESVGSFLGKVSDPHFWLRALEVVGGVMLILLGLYLLARQVGVAQPVEDVAGVLPAGRAAKLSEEGAAAMQLSPGTAAPARRKAATRRVVHQHYLEERSRRREISDPSTNEIPF